MSGYSNSPKIIKGGIVLVDPVGAGVRRQPWREVAGPHSHRVEVF